MGLGISTGAAPAFVQYEHHGVIVWVREDLKGKHRDHCLCYWCELFKPGEADNCAKAERNFETCVEESMVLPVYECPAFRFAGRRVDE